MSSTNQHRVFFITPNIYPVRGGISRLATELVEALRDHGQEVVVLAGSSVRHLGESDTHLAVMGLGRLVRWLSAVELLARTLLLTVRQDFDVVQVVTWRSGIGLLAVPRRFCPPIVIMAMGSELGRVGLVSQWLRDRSFQRADLVVAISSATAEILYGIGLSPGKVRVISPGVGSLDEDTPTRSPRVALDSDRMLRLVSVGRLDLRKGHLDTIETVAKLLDMDISCHLTIVGSGSDRGVIEEAIETAGLLGRVGLAGDVSDERLGEIYRGSDIFILLTKTVGMSFEGFGIVFLEAAQHGLPVVAGISGGSTEAVDHGFNGYLVASADEAATTLAELWLDHDKFQAFGRASLAWSRRFAWPEISSRYSQLFEDLASTRNACQSKDER